MSNFYEKDLEEIIYQNRYFIASRGFPTHEHNMIRQLRLPSGRIIDLFSYEMTDGDTIRCTIFELKKDQATYVSVLQVSKYAEEVDLLLHPYFENITIRKILIGTDFTKEFATLYQNIDNIEFYLYKYLVDGIRFKKYQKADEITNPDFISILNEPTESAASFLELLLKSATD